MKKTLIIISVLMALGSPSYASPISQQWIKTYGTSNDDIINCIQQTIDGGYIAVGNTRTDPASAIDLLITKLDVNGNVLWQKIYPYGTWINDAYAVQQTSDGGYIVAGFTGNVGFGAGWILNLDSNGDILWQKAYSGVVQFKSIHQTADGGYIAAGDVVKADDSADVVVVKLTSDGNITWAKQYNFADVDDTNDVLQTDDGGYILTVYAPGVRILKLDNDGKIVWQKSYSGSDTALSIQQTNDGGYIVAGLQNSGCCDDDAMAFKLDSSGAIVWQRKYISSNGDVYLTHIKQTTDGDYTAVGYMFVNSVNWRDILALHLDSSGNIIWQKTYGGLSEDFGAYFGKTIDGGTIIAGNTFTDGIGDLMILKLDRSGEIPDCNIINTADVEAASSSMTSYNTTVTHELPSITIVDTDSSPQDVSFNSSLLCYYDDPNDIDGDGVESNTGGAMASSMYSSSFLADGDNCSDMPNGPYLGTCTEGKIGSTCIAHAACGANGYCSMAQEDTYPPQGNDIGDACDCESDFNCDADVDGSDASTFKADFGRSTIIHPCIAGDTCNGDFNCDGDVDGTDASLFKSDFGRGQFLNPCPACVQGDWCGYGEPFVSGYWDSGCLGSFMEFAGGTCGDDEIVAEVTGNVIHLTHFNAFYNCCPDDIPVTMTVEGNLLRLQETESNVGCRCMCCYTVESEIADLEPGEYTIEYCWKCIGGPCETLMVTVTD